MTKVTRAMFREIATGLRFPEGPIAMPDGSFLVVEIARGTLSRITPDGKVSIVARTGGGPNGAAIGPDGYCYVCNSGGFEWHEDANGLRTAGQAKDYKTGRIERIDLSTGKVEVIYDHGPNGMLRGPNDLVFDKAGGFWFTDRGKTRPRDMDRGGIFYATVDGSRIEEAAYPFLSPNGIGLSPGDDRLYVAESLGGRVWYYDVVSPGRISREPFPSPNGGKLLAGLGGYHLIDSMAVDSAGNVCAATLMNGGIAVIAPDGEFIEHVLFPDLYTTNVCFGGPNLTTAYVTLSQSGKLVAIDWPRPGLRLHF